MNYFFLVAIFATFVVVSRYANKAIAAIEAESLKTSYSTKNLFLVALLCLFTEMVLIRWIGTEVRVFAFVQNLALITCFVGFGIGCFNADKPRSLLRSMEAIAIIVLLVCAPLDEWQEFLLYLSNVLTLSGDSALWGNQSVERHALLMLGAVIVVSLLLWKILDALIAIGSWVGYYLDAAPNLIRAYSVDLAGSLAGTWIFALMSWFFLPPVWWFALIFCLVCYFYKANLTALKPTVALAAFVLLMVGVIAPDKMAVETVWSPYQKLSLFSASDNQYELKVNNTGYMSLHNTSDALLQQNQEIKKRLQYTSYDSPFNLIKNGADVLIIGAGGGNDASAALRNKASTIDAVEIDPGIRLLGTKYHPDRPYDDPKVNLILNDARNYLRTTSKKYDAVIFGLLDSHTGPSGYSNLRVDNYVYTQESFEQARKLLKPEGLLVLKFEVRDPWTWIGSRFYTTLSHVFGHPPLVWYSQEVGQMWPATVYVNSKDPKFVDRLPEHFKQFVKDNPPRFSLNEAIDIPMATDDWPYPYNLEKMIPETYLTVSIILVVIAVIRLRRNLHFSGRTHWHMLSLGAGFMLMETQLINRLCLYFGTTWIVSAIGITTVLIVLILANWYLLKIGMKTRLTAYVVMLISLIANYLIDWDSFDAFPATTGILLTLFFAVSIMMSGLIFASAFREVEKKSYALGANILGAVIGGILQNISFYVGLQALLLLAAAVYFISALLDRSLLRRI